MEFAGLPWLWALWLVPALALVLRLASLRARVRVTRMVGALAPRLVVNGGPQRLRAGLLLGALGASAVALARPAWGVFYEEVQHEGVDLVVLLDVSRSMLAEDASPNRLARARFAIERLIDKLDETGGHRVGLVAFAGTAVVRCPLTVDYAYFRDALGRTGVGTAPRGGTLIGDAIRRALDLFAAEGEQQRALVLLTDGEDHESFPLEAARAAAGQGVSVYAIGIGDPAGGGRIPYTDSEGNRRFVMENGEPVVSRLDEETLLEIARLTHGAYVPAGTHTIRLGEIYEEAVAARHGGVHAVTKERRLHEQFQWFVGLGLALALASAFAVRRPEDAA
jgi:Ca-activated chloride channel homolog